MVRVRSGPALPICCHSGIPLRDCEDRLAFREAQERLAAAGRPAPQAAARLHEQAVAEGRPITRQHEVLVALQLEASRAWRQIRAKGHGDQDRGACAVLIEGGWR